MIAARVGWAIAGTGNIARRFAEDMRFSAKGRVVAVASADPQRARSLANAIGPDTAWGALDDVLARPDVDAVYVAGRNEWHCDHALRSLGMGKPVLVEKPFASSLAEAELVAETARSSGLLAMEAMWMRFIPAMWMLRARILRGDIGSITSLQASLSFANAQPNAAVVPDLGVYPLSLAVQLLGPPSSIAASATGNGRQVAITLGYREALASLVCGFDAEGANRATVVGNLGFVTTDAPLFSPTLLALRRTGPVSVPTIDGVLSPSPRLAWRDALRSVARPFRSRRSPLLYRGNGLHYQADHFADCIRARLAESPIMPLDESIEVMRIVDRVGMLLASR